MFEGSPISRHAQCEQSNMITRAAAGVFANLLLGNPGPRLGGPKQLRPTLLSRSFSSALLPFFGEGSPTKIDCSKKGTLILTSLLEDLAIFCCGQLTMLIRDPGGSDSIARPGCGTTPRSVHKSVPVACFRSRMQVGWLIGICVAEDAVQYYRRLCRW